MSKSVYFRLLTLKEKKHFVHFVDGTIRTIIHAILSTKIIRIMCVGFVEFRMLKCSKQINGEINEKLYYSWCFRSHVSYKVSVFVSSMVG